MGERERLIDIWFRGLGWKKEEKKDIRQGNWAMWSLECGDVTSHTLWELQPLSDGVGTQIPSAPMDHCWILLLGL